MGNDLEIQFPLRQIRPPVSVRERQDVPGHVPRITQVLALAIYFQDMIERKAAKDYADVGRLAGLCRERVSQIMRLNYLAPDIQIELLYLPLTTRGRAPFSESAVRGIANVLPWAEQRRLWKALRGRGAGSHP